MARPRRQGVRRSERVAARLRRRRQLVGTGAAVALGGLVVLGAAGYLPLPELGREFPLRELHVEAPFEQVSRETVRALVAPHVSAGFFRSDMAAVRRALLGHPWVRTASVRRVWPDALHIRLTEEQAIARWGDDGLLNTRGEVFRAAHRGDKALPRLSGPERSSAQIAAFHAFARERLEPLGIRITALTMDERRSWEMTLASGIRVVLGTRDAEGQLARLARTYPASLAGRAAEIERIDLRYSNGFAVRWRASGAAARGDKMTRGSSLDG